MCECAIRAFATFTELDSVSLVWAAGMTTAEASFSGFRLLAKGAIGPGQATPKAWVTQTVPNAKTAPINGLTALRSAIIRANGLNIAAFASYLGVIDAADDR